MPTTESPSQPAVRSRTVEMTVVAQDPGVRDHRGKIVTSRVRIPAENLRPGPRGFRVHVIDYDTSGGTLYEPLTYSYNAIGEPVDRYQNATNDIILGDPGFHAQNVYALVMHTLARFEFALGRRIRWSFQGGGHQIYIAPHAFADANAFYSPDDQALVFGYFPSRKRGTVFTCLSHDVVAHETTHALVDGLRDRFTDPSSPDQAAFHEGYSDVVALLSVFAMCEVVKTVLSNRRAANQDEESQTTLDHLIDERRLTTKALRRSLLLGLAEEMGTELASMRGDALRRSAELEPSDRYLDQDEFQEPHRRGEILVAAIMNAFLGVFTNRLKSLGRIKGRYLDRDRVAEEAAEVAGYLLTMSIRALDYTPPVHLEFGHFLSALLTADHEIRPDDSKFNFRETLRSSFLSYGIKPNSVSPDGLWSNPQVELVYERSHFEPMRYSPEEVFHFVHENREALKLDADAYTRVLSVQPCIRIAPEDGFPLRETVAQCIQQLTVRASELKLFGIGKPEGMPADLQLEIQGGLTLIFDEYGRLKFAISNHLQGSDELAARQTRRLRHLWEAGRYERGYSLGQRLSQLHRLRATGGRQFHNERW